MTPPTVSVITVCFNSEKTIGSTIDSVNAQSYDQVEHVFIDGDSRDGTLSVIHRESRVPNIIVSEPDQGIFDAVNKGLAIATGDVVGFLNADDFYANTDVLENIAAEFSKSAVSGVYGDLEYVYQDDISRVMRYWRTQEFTPARLRRGWMPPHPTLYVRKHWYDRIGGFNTDYSIAADYLSMLQLFTDKNFKSIYIPEVLVKMRMGGVSNRSLKNIIQKSLEDYDALKRTGVG